MSPLSLSAVQKNISFLARIFLFFTLMVPALFKFQDPGAFFAILPSYGITSVKVRSLIIIWLPCAEFVTAITLLVGWFIRGSAIIASLLFGIFASITTKTLLKGVTLVSCGCLGGWQIPLTWLHPIFNLFCLCACLHILYWGPGPYALESFWNRHNHKNH